MIIWLASYPRSGNTLLRMILKTTFGANSAALREDGKDMKTDRVAVIIGLTDDPRRPDQLNELRSDTAVHFIKSHRPPGRETRAIDRVIYIIRDGRDAVVSYRNLLIRRLAALGKPTDLDLADVIMGKRGYGRWAHHTRDWDPARFAGYQLVRYEDMLNDRERVIGEVGAFLKKKPKAAKLPTFESLHKEHPNFFRKGAVGSWREEMSESDEVLFWLLNGATMQKYGYASEVPARVKPFLADEPLLLKLESVGWERRRRPPRPTPSSTAVAEPPVVPTTAEPPENTGWFNSLSRTLRGLPERSTEESAR